LLPISLPTKTDVHCLSDHLPVQHHAAVVEVHSVCVEDRAAWVAELTPLPPQHNAGFTDVGDKSSQTSVHTATPIGLMNWESYQFGYHHAADAALLQHEHCQ